MRLPSASLLLSRLSEFPVEVKNLFCVLCLANSRCATRPRPVPVEPREAGVLVLKLILTGDTGGRR